MTTEQTLQDKLRKHAGYNIDTHSTNYMRQAADRIDELERQLAEAQKDQADAKRYRWIVKDIDEKGCAKFDEFFYTSFESLSDYIDAAIAQKKVKV